MDSASFEMKNEWDPKDCIERYLAGTIAPALAEKLGDRPYELIELQGGVVSPTYQINSPAGTPLAVVKVPGQKRKNSDVDVPPRSAERGAKSFAMCRAALPDILWLPEWEIVVPDVENGLLFMAYIPGELLSEQLKKGQTNPFTLRRIGRHMAKLAVNSWGNGTNVLSAEEDAELAASEYEMKVASVVAAYGSETDQKIACDLRNKEYAPQVTLANPYAKNWLVDKSGRPYAIDLDQAALEKSPARSFANLLSDLVLERFRPEANVKRINRQIAIVLGSYESVLRKGNLNTEDVDVDAILGEITQWCGLGMLYRGSKSVAPYRWIQDQEGLVKMGLKMLRTGGNLMDHLITDGESEFS